MVKETEATPVNIEFNAKIHNRFDIEVRDAVTGEIKQQAQAFNVICNALWTQFFNNGVYFAYIIYGSGSGTPSASDTELFSKINAMGAQDAVYSVDDSTNNAIASLRKDIIIGTEVSNGETITEVGIGYDATHIVTHAMLQDMNGNPISILKTGADIITIYATIYLHYQRQNVDDSIIIYGSSNQLYLFMNGGNLGSGLYLGNHSYVDSGGGFALQPPSTNPATKTLSYSYRILVDSGNVSRGLNSVYLYHVGVRFSHNQFNLSNFAISGESVGTGDGSTTEFDTQFPIKSGATVYIDGVAQQSGVTINTGLDYVFDSLLEVRDSDNNNLIPFVTNPIMWGRYAYSCIFVNKNLSTFTGFDYSSYDYLTSFQLFSSNDGNTWELITNAIRPKTFANPVNSRYIKLMATGDSGASLLSEFRLISPNDKTHDIIFDTAPAAGSVITIDYIPECIPKDTNHVFDVTATITLGEYVGN